jgi:hypothetical protein
METERARIIVTSSLVSCDGMTVNSCIAGLVPRKLDTGIRVVVPQNQLCYFLPINERKFKKVIFSPSPAPQPLYLKSYSGARLKKDKLLGVIQFVTVNRAIKLEWQDGDK